MRFLSSLRSLYSIVFHRSEVDGEMDEELRSHIDLRADDLERRGMSRSKAERQARVEFGGYVKFKEQGHESMGGQFLEILWQDVRFSVRKLRKSPGFTIAAVLTLALAIGANAVVFGIMDSLILRPLHVPQAESLWGTENGNGSGWQSYPNYLDLRDRNRSFDGLAAIRMEFVGLDAGNNPSSANGWATTGNYFDVLRIHPYLGRFFSAADERGPGSAPYLVLSYAYWHSHFQDDRGVLGRTVLLNKHPFTVIGVTPPEFRGTLLFFSPDFFMPIVNQGQVDGVDILNVRGITNSEVFEVIGHLKPGVTPAQAVAELNSTEAYLEKTYPKEEDHKMLSLGRPGLYVFAGSARAFVGGLMLLAGLILLAACANLGSLFGAHAADRSREVALRLSLGSSRTRILRQLLTEAMLVSLAGGALGVSGSVVLLRRLSTWQPFSAAPIYLPISPDAKIYVVALALALLSGLLFGIVPVRQILRANPYEIVKAGSSGRVGHRLTVRDVLLIVQIAICAVLVTSSMVAVRGLVRSLHSSFGFDPRNTMLAGTDLAMAGYKGDEIPQMQKRMIDAIGTIPGVEQVGLVNNYPPLVNVAGNTENIYKDETRDLKQSNVAATPYRYEVSPGYFDAAGTALLVGRSFSWHDDRNAPRVAVVNREFAVRIFGSVANVVNKHFRLQDGTRVEVVGVVKDGKYMSLTEDQKAAIFLPFLQSPASLSFVLVRANFDRGRDPEQLAAAMRNKIHELDAGLPAKIDTWNGLLDVVLFPSRVATVALGVLGVMGAMLSITGIFGMAAYSVSKRLRELGIRMALGAQRKEVLQAALGRPLKLLAFGSAAGLLLGLLATKVLAFIVYQATPRDPLVLGGVVFAMMLLGLLATWIPAQRALSVDPLILLREE
jgi:predicted permease